MVPTTSLALSHFAEICLTVHQPHYCGVMPTLAHCDTVAPALHWHPARPPTARSLTCAVTRRVRGPLEGCSQARKGWRKVTRGWFLGEFIFVRQGRAGVEPRCGAAAAAAVGREVGQRGRGSTSVRQQQKREQHQPEPPLASSIFSEPAASPSHCTASTPGMDDGGLARGGLVLSCNNM